MNSMYFIEELRLKWLFAVVCCLLSFRSVYAQENYLAGTIIKHNGDTLSGYVDFRDWKVNPNRVNFKSTLESASVSYYPLDIMEFSVNNEIYVGAVVDTEISSLEFGNLSDKREPIIKVDTTFLQTFFRGEKSLFYYMSADRKNHFYYKNGDEYELLLYKRYNNYREGERVTTGKEGHAVAENKKFVGQLIVYLDQCPAIQEKFQSLSYSLKSLTALFQTYYGCITPDASFEKKREQVSLEGGLLGGVSSTHLGFGGFSSTFSTNTEFEKSKSAAIGAFFNIRLPGNQGKWSIVNEIMISSYKVSGNYSDIESDIEYSITETEIGFSYFKLNNMLRFEYPVGPVFLFVNGGISNGLGWEIANDNHKETSILGIEKVVDEPALADYRSYEQGLIVGAGLKWGQVSFEVRHEKGNGISAFQTLSSVTKRRFFLIGYRF